MLSKHYPLQLDHKLGNGKFAIIWIPCSCIDCTIILDKPWAVGSDTNRQPRYQPVEDCKYWPLLGYFIQCKIIQFTNKITTNEYFDAVHKFVLDSISDNMYALVQNVNHNTINTADPTITGYYVVKFLS